MPAFQFRFAPLLNQRRRDEQQAQRDLAQHLRERMILQNQLRTMQQTITDAKAQMAEGLVGKVDLHAISDVGAYHGQTAIRGRQLAGRLAELEHAISNSRQALMEKTKNRKALELLEQQHHDQWRREQVRRESAQMEELATTRYAHAEMLHAANDHAFAAL